MSKKKITLSIPIEKPRNHLIVAMASMKAGSHRKPDKTLRSQAKSELKKNIQAELKNRLFYRLCSSMGSGLPHTLPTTPCPIKLM